VITAVADDPRIVLASGANLSDVWRISGKERAMPTAPQVARIDHEASQWDQAFYAFLAEKERRSGSLRTVSSYSRMLDHFWSGIGKIPDQVTAPEVFSWAHGIGLSGKRPSSVTVGARLACLSSFYRFLIRMGLVRFNPCEAIERPKARPTDYPCGSHC
jgi:site-specific recombinase XerD